MGARIDGFLCYGVKVSEENVFPWDSKKYDGDWYEWWEGLTGEEEPFFDVCSYNIEPDHDDFILCIMKYSKGADLGRPTVIEPSELTVDASDDREFKEFIAAHNIKAEGHPQWWLCCSWRR